MLSSLTYTCIHLYTYIRVHTYVHIYRLSAYPPHTYVPHCRCLLPVHTLKLRNPKSCLKFRIFQQPGYQDQVVQTLIFQQPGYQDQVVQTLMRCFGERSFKSFPYAYLYCDCLYITIQTVWQEFLPIPAILYSLAKFT